MLRKILFLMAACCAISFLTACSSGGTGQAGGAGRAGVGAEQAVGAGQADVGAEQADVTDQAGVGTGQAGNGAVQPGDEAEQGNEAEQDNAAEQTQVLTPRKIEGLSAYRWEGLERTGGDDPVLCNLSRNNPGDVDALLPLCPDPVYGILYYVNCRADNYIYGSRDGRTEKIADIPAKRLFCRDGRLYFLVDYGKCDIEGIQIGNILEYDPVQGEISLIVDKASSMVVYQDGIYYSDQVARDLGGGYYTKEGKSYLYSFADGSLKELRNPDEYHHRTLHRCGEGFFFLIMEEEAEGEGSTEIPGLETGKMMRLTGMMLGNLDLTRGQVLTGLDAGNSFTVVGKEVYYVEKTEKGSQLIVYDTESMTKKDYFLGERGSGVFGILDGQVYFSNKARLDLDSGTAEWCTVGEDFVLSFYITAFYTDGEDLYVLCQQGGGKEQLMKQVIEDDVIYYTPVIE